QAVRRVHDDAAGTHVRERVRLVLAARQADDVVAGGDELGDEEATDGAGGAGDEDAHGGSFRSAAWSGAIVSRASTVSRIASVTSACDPRCAPLTSIQWLTAWNDTAASAT